MIYYSYKYICCMLDHFEKLIPLSRTIEERVYRMQQWAMYDEMRRSVLN